MESYCIHTLTFFCPAKWLSVVGACNHWQVTNRSTNSSLCLLLLSASCWLSWNCICAHVSSSCFEGYHFFPFFLKILISSLPVFTPWPSFPAVLQVISDDVCEHIQHRLCVQTSPNHAIMSFSAQHFPCNERGAWQRKQCLIVSVLAACPSLLLSADQSEKICSVCIFQNSLNNT